MRRRGALERATDVGRYQIMEGVTGPGEEFGFYSESCDNIWKAVAGRWYVLIYILKRSLWLPYGE